MKIKKTITLILALLMALTIAACGGGGGSGAGGGGGTANAPSPESSPEYDYGYADSEGNFGFISNRTRALNDAADMSGSDESTIMYELNESTIPADRKVIRNADLEIMADDASALYRNITNYAAQIGGYEHSYSIYNYETYSVINAVLKIPPERLNSFVNFIGENGDIINSSMKSEDITENYFDAVTRLDTKRKSLESYYRLLQNASGVEEIAYIQRIIDGITEDIESLEGKLKFWNSQVNMATVSLYIRQNNDPMQIRKEISWNTLSTDDMGYLIKQGFFSVTNGIVSILQWIIVVLIGYSPLWIMLAVCAFIWIKIRKKFNILKVFRKKNE
jgi:hypothetical protein